MFKLMYLKDGIAKLNYDYYIWLDPSTRSLSANRST